MNFFFTFSSVMLHFPSSKCVGQSHNATCGSKKPASQFLPSSMQQNAIVLRPKFPVSGPTEAYVRSISLVRYMAVVCACLFLAAPMKAQVAGGTVTGTEDGIYTVPNLVPGDYQVKATAKGYHRQHRIANCWRHNRRHEPCHWYHTGCDHQCLTLTVGDAYK